MRITVELAVIYSVKGDVMSGCGWWPLVARLGERKRREITLIYLLYSNVVKEGVMLYETA